ncbi:MAG: PIG-L deacetylase family protein, partial [Sporichthyaceae bacterium]
ELRAAEARAAGALLGARVEFLGYEDSGEAAADFPPASFAAADVEEAAARLHRFLADLGADAFVNYDEFGVTGHPDHRQCHLVGRRAAELAQQDGQTLWVYEGTMGQPQVELIDELMEGQSGLRAGSADGASMVTVEVGTWIELKRKAMAAHASQITEESIFLRLPPDLFAKLWGTEYYLAFSGPGPLAEFATTR